MPGSRQRMIFAELPYEIAGAEGSVVRWRGWAEDARRRAADPQASPEDVVLYQHLAQTADLQAAEYLLEVADLRAQLADMQGTPHA